MIIVHNGVLRLIAVESRANFQNYRQFRGAIYCQGVKTYISLINKNLCSFFWKIDVILQLKDEVQV